MDPEDLVVDKSVWESWLQMPATLKLLREVEIDVSARHDLFDALDVELTEAISLDTLIGGLMKLRGPINKLDIVATRLKVTHIMRMTIDICHKLGIQYDKSNSRTTDL